MLLDRHDHVGEHRRAAGTGDGEQIWETCHLKPQKGRRARRPRVAQGLTASTGDVDPVERAGHRIETGGEHDVVDMVVHPIDDDRRLGDLLDGCRRYVDQRDVRPVEGAEVVGVDHQPLAADGRVGTQHRCRLRIVDDLGDARTDIRGRRRVGFGVQQQVVERAEKEQAADLPPSVVGGPALLLRHVHRAAVQARHMATEAGAGVTRRLAPLDIVGLDRRNLLRVERLVVSRYGVRRGALEHDDLISLLGDQRDRLHSGTSRADHRHAATSEVDSLMWPSTRVEGPTAELVATRDGREVR